MFNKLEEAQKETVIRGAEESSRFWNGLWDQAVTHRGSTDWLRKVENELGEMTVQDAMHIEIKKSKKADKKNAELEKPRA